jgi:hypothetical protein
MLQRVGGSLGVAVFSIVLARHLGHGTGGTSTSGAAAPAFGATYQWLVGISALAILSLMYLARCERTSKRADEAAHKLLTPAVADMAPVTEAP